MNRRSTPEADTQRAIVQALRVALPRDAIVHYAVNEIAANDRRGQIRRSDGVVAALPRRHRNVPR